MVTEERYNALRDEGYANTEIAKMEGLNYASMRCMLLALNIWRPSQKIHDHYKNYIRIRPQKRFLYQVAQEMGIHQTTLYEFRARWGVLGDTRHDYKGDIDA